MTEMNTENRETKELLAALFDEFKRMNEKLDLIVETNTKLLRTQSELHQTVAKFNGDQKRATKEINKETKLEPDTIALLSLPASLRKTAIALYKFDEATADDLANETKRLRGVESNTANQLARMGYIKKRREGRKVFFYIE